MALKKRISKADFEKLSDHFKGEYIEDGEGYRLDVDGDEDVGPLKRAKDRESQLRREAEERLREAQAEVDRLSANTGKSQKDIELLERKWKKDLDDANLASQAKIDKLTAHARTNLVDNVALQIAGKLTTSPALLLPHIKARLLADFDGDAPATKIIGADGKPSTMSLDDLTAEFRANKDFSAIITASKSSGGAGSKNPIPGGAQNSKPQGDVMLSKMTPQQMVEHIKSIKSSQSE